MRQSEKLNVALLLSALILSFSLDLVLITPFATAKSLPPATAATISKVDEKSDVVSLPDVVRRTMAWHFHDPSASKYANLDQIVKSYKITDKYKKTGGVFVTLSINGKTRACWGAVSPHYANLIEGTVYTTESALNKDFRHPKIHADEWQLLKPQVTVVRSLIPISGIRGLNPLVFGLMVSSGSKGAVLLPGEAIDPYYQLVQCKLKAGIPSNKSCQLYRINADVFK